MLEMYDKMLKMLELFVLDSHALTVEDFERAEKLIKEARETQRLAFGQLVN
jgi:hypothetical protein